MFLLSLDFCWYQFGNDFTGFIQFYIHTRASIYLYIHMFPHMPEDKCVSVCMCVCAPEESPGVVSRM